MKILSAEFVTSATEPAGYPRGDAREIAFAGRSNVGKSSMINALAQRHKLVRVSNTPGRTRLLNFFDVRVEDDEKSVHEVRFCDLPGYGFAKVSKAERKQWQQMIEAYIASRPQLCGVVCIVDANVGPTEDDLQVIPWVQKAGRRVIVAGTKIDRIPKHRRIPRAREIEKALQLEYGQVVGVSATDKIGLEDLWAKIFEASALAESDA